MPGVLFKPPLDWITAKAIDGYAGAFESLATRRLPELFVQLETQMRRGLPMCLFEQGSCGPAQLLRNERFRAHFAGLEDAFAEARAYTDARQGSSSEKNNFAGVYVFLTDSPRGAPFYVGNSRTVFRRVRGHLRSRKHNTATFLFQLVRSLVEGKPKSRKEVDLGSTTADSVLAWLRDQRVAILPLASPVERYAFELYASMKLQTGRWNTFETH